MKLLIAVASRHGGTEGIATRLGARLRDHGHDVDVMSIDGSSECPDVYDAYVIGSAVYAGRWLTSGQWFVRHHLGQLRARPLWLFSSGPLGERAGPAGVDHPEAIAMLAGARDHHVFAGRMFRRELGRMERVVAVAVRAPEGDFRDWADVDAWADRIDTDLRELALTRR